MRFVPTTEMKGVTSFSSVIYIFTARRVNAEDRKAVPT